uniref:hypothetical protein n=1 Tax=Vibrio cholerae TaxID=666 RepID=UPI001F3E5384
ACRNLANLQSAMFGSRRYATTKRDQLPNLLVHKLVSAVASNVRAQNEWFPMFLREDALRGHVVPVRVITIFKREAA